MKLIFLVKYRTHQRDVSNPTIFTILVEARDLEKALQEAKLHLGLLRTGWLEIVGIECLGQVVAKA